uniref:Uncharacterized protein n=1 Tax=Octopus bimaculoides TaxID=37653 RepID=A0A0L8HTU4_OCTBM
MLLRKNVNKKYFKHETQDVENRKSEMKTSHIFNDSMCEAFFQMQKKKNRNIIQAF